MKFISKNKSELNNENLIYYFLENSKDTKVPEPVFKIMMKNEIIGL